MKCMIAGIAVEKTAASFDDLFSYLVPDGLKDDVCVGMRVAVPFGRSNKTRAGVVFALSEKENDGKLKSIISAADDGIFLGEEMLKLAKWLKETTFCTYYDAVRTMLPAGLSIKAEEKYAFADKYIAEGLTEQEKAIASLLTEEDKLVDDVIAKSGLAAASVLATLTVLEIKGVIKRLPGKRIALK